MWPTGTGGVDSLRITDFTSTPPPSALRPKPPGACTGGPTDAKYQQLDVATGDFDGDGNDELVAAYSRPTGDPWTQLLYLEVPEVREATLDWTTSHSQSLGPIRLPVGSYRSPSQVRLVAGRFMPGEDLEQFVIARRIADGAGGHIQIDLAVLLAGLPFIVATTDGQYQPDDMKESVRFDVAAGDFDGDGTDELVVGGVRKNASNNLEVFATIYAFDGGAFVQKATSSYGNWTQDLTSVGEGHYFDHVAIATGNLRTQLKDQILFSYQDRYEDWWEAWCDWGYSKSHWYGQVSASLHTLTVNTSGAWTIAGWGVDTKSISKWEEWDSGCVWTHPLPYDKQDTGSSLGVAVGDLTGDGLDEVVWAAADSVRVYQVDTGSWSLLRRAAVGKPFMWKDPARRIVEVVDLDASLTTPEWRSEIVIMDWSGPSNSQRIRVLQASTDASGRIKSPLSTLASRDASHITLKGGDVALACGDFDGDGFRLGTPTPHTFDEVIQPTVILGAPPVHFDVFDQPYDITGCYPGNNTYSCTDFASMYSITTFDEFAIQAAYRTDWGLSTELKAHADAFGLNVEGSFKATYGEGFSRTGSQVRTRTVTGTITTTGGDRILVDRLSYDMWEYPVYGAGHQLMGHVGVMIPGTVVSWPEWISFDTWTQWAGSGAPAVTHEPGNILSYQKVLPDSGVFGDMWDVFPLFEVTGAQAMSALAPYDYHLLWSTISSKSFSNSWTGGFAVGASVSYEASDPFGIATAGISASVDGNYEASEMATHSMTAGQDIDLGVTLGNLGGAWQAPYHVYPFVYRSSTAGTLVLDYQVEPTSGNNWWNVYKGAPDFTFTMPRLHWEDKGIPIWDPTSKYRSPDVRVYPGIAVPGDTVTIRAIVRNFSLLDYDDPVTVRFYAGDPDGPNTQIHDILGRGDFSVTNIPAREGRPVALQWIVPSFMPDTVRIYAEADPDSLVDEVHEYNNKGYVEFYVIGGDPLDAPAQSAGVPFRLEQSIPNPFQRTTMIAFGLPERTQVTLNVYDISGRLITTLVNQELAPGRHEFRWDGRGRDGNAVRPGIYLYRIKAGSHGETRRIVRVN